MGSVIRYNFNNAAVTGNIDVRVKANGVPAKEYIEQSDIVDWNISIGGKILTPSEGEENRGLHMQNQGLGNRLLVTDKCLCLQGEAGSYISFTKVLGGVKPFQRVLQFSIEGIERNNTGFIKYEASEGNGPNNFETLHSSQTQNRNPLGFTGNVVEIASNPFVMSSDNVPPPNNGGGGQTPPQQETLEQKRDRLVNELCEVNSLLNA